MGSFKDVDEGSVRDGVRVPWVTTLKIVASNHNGDAIEIFHLSTSYTGNKDRRRKSYYTNSG